MIAGQKSGWIHAIDPDREGEIIWQRRISRGGNFGGIQWGPAADRNNVYVAISDLDDRRRLLPNGDYVRELNPLAGGGLFALDLLSGTTKWQAEPVACDDRRLCSPAQSAAVTVASDVVFSGSISGHLRGYSASTGKIIWSYDTNRPFATKNAVKGARGGAIDGPGPVVVDDMVYTNSGYGSYGGQPGNILLAFALEPENESGGPSARRSHDRGAADAAKALPGASLLCQLYSRGNRIYFLSDRDGFRCIWALNLDGKTKQPLKSVIRCCPCMIHTCRCCTYPIP